MKISIFGSGYVGLVTGVCLAARGHDVICVDINKERIDLLNTGFIPIYEPGLDRILKKSIKNKKISFTTNSKKAVIESKLIFIAVGTPPAEDGSADLQYVLDVAKNIGDSINAFKVVINKSTVPVGSQKKVKNIISKQIKKRNKEIKFSVCSNPEFLKEGAAINDFNKPDRIICGIEDGDKKSKKLLEECYKPFIKKIMILFS
jgi:UDPglucose 6-dehydrogenase